jgi:tartrate-resistant acid phosphatase type 5
VYVVLGNHDWHTVANQTAELAYTAYSKRWRMSDVNQPSESPNYYYLVQETFTPPAGAPVTVDIVFIDTVILAGLSLDEAALNATTHKHDHARLPRSAALADPAAVELAWINKTMAASTADWLIVSGHCECSGALHWQARCVDDDVKMQKWSVSFACVQTPFGPSRNTAPLRTS